MYSVSFRKSEKKNKYERYLESLNKVAETLAITTLRCIEADIMPS